jgi:hypothetical protein
VVEGSDLLDGDLLAGRFVDGRAVTVSDSPTPLAPDSPDNPVGALADDILDFILVGDVEGDLARAPLRR